MLSMLKRSCLLISLMMLSACSLTPIGENTPVPTLPPTNTVVAVPFDATPTSSGNQVVVTLDNPLPVVSPGVLLPPTDTPAPAVQVTNTVAPIVASATPIPTTQPTSTPQSGDAPEVIGGKDDPCVAIASGLFQAQTLNAQRTLPNGNAFPNTQPMMLAGGGGQPDWGVVNITFTPDSQRGLRQIYVSEIGGRVRDTVDPLNLYIVELRRNLNIDQFPESDIVVNIEPEYTAVASQIANLNDTRVGEQWALPIVGVPDAWTGVSGNVVVAVIDSGVCMNHPDLQGRLVAGYDFVEDDNVPQDEFGHGCGVAGVIAANSNNAVGIAGIAPNAQIMPLRVLDASGLGGYSRIAQAIIYAVDNGADIINLSLAGANNSSVLASAVNYALDRNVVVIAAAGNFGRDGAYYPAALPGVIGVGALDNTLQRSSFSHFGAGVDTYAPGRDILTTNIANDYQMQTGTSFAAPIVSGIAALKFGQGVPFNLIEDEVISAIQIGQC